ncbi:SDR family NAD(P)-dependent oxidoreductase [Mycolicibacter terrae]|uniref:Short-chain dehydrogenase n=2 Tax=Mycolicibacter TaxID=1073531 RepID=A0A1A2NZZ1_MYCSD|nr:MULTISPECIES: SDR family NAD(P)-dependent oxidoreductase [Mycolicibacter]OBH20639.1 short-chain dehydrogenase [Mycolicibacter sinensis]OBI26421.1 short-chain dehydrogenase [Mycolicibacter sinensis]RRR44626.1 SDR family NAD(P)-dependent oxidoreductase [Mycolicibacter terrae]
MSSGSDQAWARQYGPWAVIAGGSEGVGAEFAFLLARAGIHLVLIARKPKPLRDTADRCRELGVQVRELALDLSRPDSLEKIVAATTGLEVGLLVYNAGANTHSAEFLDGDLAAFQQVIDLNVTTPLALIHHFAGPMRARRRGGVMLIGSLTGYLGSARHTVYGGVKAFTRIFAEGLWLELRDYNVHVLELVLGVTKTPAMQRVGLNFDVPGLRVSDPADVAREGLTQLARGPVHVVSDHADNPALHAGPDRAEAVLGSHRWMQKLLQRKPGQTSDAPPPE